MQSIVSRALDLIPNNSRIGLGSGRAARAFMKALGERVRGGRLHVYGVGTSAETERIAMQEDIPPLTLDQGGELDLTVDGADEVDADLNLIKGYGRALVREKVVAAASRQLIILVGEEKLVSKLGSRGKLPVEVLPFALPLCERRLRKLGLMPSLYRPSGLPFLTDNGYYILDCAIEPIGDPPALEAQLRAIPGVVGTGLFLDMADIVLVGKGSDSELVAEKRREQELSKFRPGPSDAGGRQIVSVPSATAAPNQLACIESV
jgi:ribose 5-phosphate isomerase A